MTDLDPSRTYTAAEVRSLLDRQTLTETAALAQKTAEGLEALSCEVRELTAMVRRLVTADEELGVANMSANERGALPAAVRAFLAGQQSSRQRERLWRRVATAAVAAGAAFGVLSTFGFISWFRIHVLGLP